MFRTYWKDSDSAMIPHQYPTLHFANQGMLRFDGKWSTGNQSIPIDSSRCLYNYTSNALTSHSLADRDILDHLDPSRLPPRPAFRTPMARREIEKEIADILKKQVGSPPAIMGISLGGPQYRRLARVPITLVADRQYVLLYKGHLCSRGGVIPLSVTGFMSSPTAHRPSVKLVCSLAISKSWQIKAMGISLAFLQSGNFRPEGRIVVFPPETDTPPGLGHYPPIGTDLKSLHRPRRGFLLHHYMAGATRLCAGGLQRRKNSRPRFHTAQERCLYVYQIRWSRKANLIYGMSRR